MKYNKTVYTCMKLYTLSAYIIFSLLNVIKYV